MFLIKGFVRIPYLGVSLYVFCREICMSDCTICDIKTDCLDKNNTCLAGGVYALKQKKIISTICTENLIILNCCN